MFQHEITILAEYLSRACRVVKLSPPGVSIVACSRCYLTPSPSPTRLRLAGVADGGLSRDYGVVESYTIVDDVTVVVRALVGGVAHYRIVTCRRPRQRTVSPGKAGGAEEGFVVCIDTLCQGVIPSCVSHEAGEQPGTPGKVAVFTSEREAQLEIVDNMMTRLRAFVDGDIDDFADVTHCEEFVLPASEVKLEDPSY